MKLINTVLIWLCMTAVLAGCAGQPHAPALVQQQQKILVVYEDGSMEYRNRPIHSDDVILYDDGFGGQRAAVRIRAEPLHPDFFADGIVVENR